MVVVCHNSIIPFYRDFFSVFFFFKQKKKLISIYFYFETAPLNLSEDKEEQIKKYFTEIQKNYNDTFSTSTRNWKGYKLNSKYNYDLTKLNCTIITINSLNTALNEKIPTIVVPKEFAKYLVGRVFAEKMGLKKNNIIE